MRQRSDEPVLHIEIGSSFYVSDLMPAGTGATAVS